MLNNSWPIPGNMNVWYQGFIQDFSTESMHNEKLSMLKGSQCMFCADIVERTYTSFHLFNYLV